MGWSWEPIRSAVLCCVVLKPGGAEEVVSFYCAVLYSTW